jgi:hypothetical protein
VGLATIFYLQVVTTLLLLYTMYSHSTLISSVYLHYSSRIYNTGTVSVSLNQTLPISLHYSTHKVFKSHVKISQADFLYSSVLIVPIRSELSQSQGHIAADGQSVSLSVLVSSPARGSWPDIHSWLKSYSPVRMGRPLWREVGSVILWTYSSRLSLYSRGTDIDLQ